MGCAVEPDLIDLQFVISHHRFEIPKQGVSNPTFLVTQNIDDHAQAGQRNEDPQGGRFGDHGVHHRDGQRQEVNALSEHF